MLHQVARRERTIGGALAAGGGYGGGFDSLRLVLALLVMMFHAGATVRSTLWTDTLTPLTHSLVPLFFGVSGFLVAGSASRLPVGPFLVNRALRILPALTAVSLVTALVVGPMVSTYGPAAYFAQPAVWQYGANSIGLFRGQLPGVFTQNGQPGIVNAALWTLAYELACYGLMAGLISVGLLRRPRLLLAVAVTLAVTPALLEALGLLPLFARNGLFRLVFLGRGAILFAAFLCGCLLYVWRDAVPRDGRLLAAALAGSGLAHWLGPDRWHLVDPALSGLCLAYIAVWIGVTDFGGRIGPYKVDYSYGLYLYHCLVLNVVVLLVPQIDSVTSLVLLAIGPTILVAAVSWHGIERPSLRARKGLGRIASRTVAALAGTRLGFQRASPLAGYRGGAPMEQGAALHPQKVPDLVKP
ncbi:acyltransferase family protein [Methylobacterium pseudosasicola]|uniref:Peptidoglycan/LPS O-acetylase OafA/YrhL, contains acyltransferase and SGNH-hydrolase domains n=1 Tax=Methylobacterium pseudosasicola TaxID=582667 RepID=A0A1I4HF82_9HYPH|nr:acyltransferase [Methylobacterium pseudosasicola]SFL40343.1 Peptidoglycan/LPS O-acetylase OafA/YrhL, contains acyltransferase and SGNH-hydrolase domains [Methylobacterium pseudosasicola]